MGQVKERLFNKEIELSVTKQVMSFLAKEGYDPKFGARPLKRLIQSKILTPVASMMVDEGVLRGGKVSVGLSKDSNELVFNVRKRGNRKELQKATRKTVTAATVATV